MPRATAPKPGQPPLSWASRSAFGSYEELLADPEIDAIYNPLPNHLHVPWSIRAAEAGKHVLCEKPIAITVEETRELIAARDRTGVKMGEAFMVDVHPQWLRTREIVRSGEIGALSAMSCVFGYNNRDPRNIRNLPEAGGGALMDIGCYPIHIARWIFGEEPQRVSALMERDPEFGTDRLISGLLDFPSGPGGLHVRHSDGAVSEDDVFRRSRKGGSRDSGQCASGSGNPYTRLCSRRPPY